MQLTSSYFNLFHCEIHLFHQRKGITLTFDAPRGNRENEGREVVLWRCSVQLPQV